MTQRRIVPIGGMPYQDAARRRTLIQFLLGLTGEERPRVMYVPTAQGDDPWAITSFYETFRGLSCEPNHLRLFGVPEPGWPDRVRAQDLILVGGGNTANMLAVWRTQGFDHVVREAWEGGTVLTGSSAGAICWFEACVTDSFRVDLDGLRNGLGLLPGSCCPHYDGEERRRPVYHELIAAGFPAGYAIDDEVALVFVDGTLAEGVAVRPGAGACRVALRGDEVVEEPVAVRLLEVAAG